MRAIVLTIDQHDSRKGPDLVPTALEALAPVPTLRPFERTAGDEIQGVIDDAAALPRLLLPLLRQQTWAIGIGAGLVETPLPPQTRAGRGEAYLAAREAVTAAKASPWQLCVRGDRPQARALETTIWLWAAVLARRTTRGWEVADLVQEGLTYEQAAQHLQISPSAVSQRAQAAGIVEGRRAGELVAHLAAELLAGKEER